jgi:serine protease Do
MRKAMVAGAALVLVVAGAWMVAPTVWSQGRSDESRDRRVVMLDGRGSSIGVSIRDRDAEGVEIEHVNENGPAAKAGMKAGDVIVEFDGERVRSARQLSRLVRETADGRTVKATIVRDGARQTVDLTPAASSASFSGDFVVPHLPENFERDLERSLRAIPKNFAFDFDWDAEWPMVASPRGRIGAELSPLSDQLAEYFGAKDGVLVSSVETDSVAAKAGLKAGDVITSINGRSVGTPREVAQGVRETEPGKEIEIGVLRGKQSMTLKAPMPERRRTAKPVRHQVRPV